MTESDLPLFFLKPGELYFGSEPTVVSTLLGSCVAITMYSARHRIGAICHALLPRCRNRQPCSGLYPEGAKYVECCIELMLSGLKQRGVAKQEIEAKVFGGANMFEVAKEASTVGRQNVEKALQLLESAGVRVVGSDLGGEKGRKLFFHTHTGEVFLKVLRKSEF